MSLFDKYTLSQDLKNGIYTIVFEKVDGTIREMRCTLQPNYLPQMLTEETGLSKGNDQVLAVWDLDNNGWRSMRVESIQTVVKED